MPKEQPENVRAVVEAFKALFGANVRPFGNPVVAGVSDGAEGVQWNAGIRDHEEAFLGVNLEGVEYRGFPVSSLIRRELQAPTLVEHATTIPNCHEIELSWRRDAWQFAARPCINE